MRHLLILGHISGASGEYGRAGGADPRALKGRAAPPSSRGRGRAKARNRQEVEKSRKLRFFNFPTWKPVKVYENFENFSQFLNFRIFVGKTFDTIEIEKSPKTGKVRLWMRA